MKRNLILSILTTFFVGFFSTGVVQAASVTMFELSGTMSASGPLASLDGGTFSASGELDLSTPSSIGSIGFENVALNNSFNIGGVEFSAANDSWLMAKPFSEVTWQNFSNAPIIGDYSLASVIMFDATQDLSEGQLPTSWLVDFSTLAEHSLLMIWSHSDGSSASKAVMFDDFTFSVRTVEISAIPLPASLPLYAAGLAIMGFFGWRHKQRQEAN